MRCVCDVAKAQRVSTSMVILNDAEQWAIQEEGARYKFQSCKLSFDFCNSADNLSASKIKHPRPARKHVAKLSTSTNH